MGPYSLTFAPVLPWWVWLALAAGLAVLLLRVYRPRLRELPRGTQRLVFGLRAVAAVVLLLLLLRPSIEVSEPDDRTAQLIVLADNSRSMSVTDALNGETRRAAAVSSFEAVREIVEDAELVETTVYDFGEAAAKVEELDPRADGDWTNVGAALETALNDHKGERIVGVVLMTDGAVRVRSPEDGDAILAAQAVAEQAGVPVTPVGFGSVTLAAEGIDLAVDDLTVEPVTFEKKTTRVRANVRLQGFDGREAIVRLLLDDGKVRPPEADVGELNEDDVPSAAAQEILVGDMKPLRAAAGTRPLARVRGRGDTTTIPVDLSFRAGEPGEYRVRVLVEPVDEELRITNNIRDALVQVQRGGLRVLYLDSARWEQKFVRMVNASSQIQLDYVFLPDREAMAELLRRADWFDTNQYDVFLIGDVPAEILADRGAGTIGTQLAAAVQRGAGVGLLAGPNNASLPRSSFSRVLPATLGSESPLRLDEGKRLYPTPEGLSHFVLRIGTDDVFERLPPLERLFPIEPVNEIVDVLAETDDGTPLLAVAETGRGRTLVAGMSDTWLWYRAGNPATHQRFWQQVLLWLGKKEDQTDDGLNLVVRPREVDRGEPVLIEVKLQQAEEQALPEGTTISLDVLRPDGELVPVLRGGSTAGVREELAETDLAGDYVVRASVVAADGAIGERVERRFLVNATDPELDRPAREQETLDQLAAVSGGTTVAPEELPTWVEELIASLEVSDSIRKKIITLWDGWPPLLAVAALLTLEWFVRKRRGLV